MEKLLEIPKIPTVQYKCKLIENLKKFTYYLIKTCLLTIQIFLSFLPIDFYDN